MKALIATLMLLTTLPAFAQRIEYAVENRGPSAPAAADQSSGMAVMSAVVNSNGALVRGSGAVSSIRTGTGLYKVTFDRPILECVMSLTSANVGPGGGTTHVFLLGFYLVNEPNTFQALAYGQTTNTPNDAAFHLLVFCGK